MKKLFFKILIVGLFSVFSSSTQSQVAVSWIYDDIGNGVVSNDFPSNGIFLLDGFRFSYVDPEHHFSALRVAPRDIATNKITHFFQDDSFNQDFRFFSKHTYYSWVNDQIWVPQFPAFDFAVANSSNSKIIQKPGDDYVFALVGFDIGYFPARTDNHIDRIGIWYDDATETLNVNLDDKDNDDLFEYTVWYVFIPKNLVEGNEKISKGQSTSSKFIDGVNTQNVFLQGFTFDFDCSVKDRDIKEIGVKLEDNKIGIFYSDKNGGDLFDYEVRWSNLKLSNLQKKIKDIKIETLSQLRE